MDGLTKSRRRKSRGASGTEYIVVVVLIAITGIAGYKLTGKRYRCKIAQATGLFSLSGEKGDTANCDDGSGGVQASNSPSPNGGSSGSSGPESSVTCVGGVCDVGDNCFVAGTLVVTQDGEKPIESIAAGMRVLSRDQEGDDVDWKPVVRTFVRKTDQLVELSIGDPAAPEIVEVTPSHRIHTKARGWVEADSLVPGNDLLVDAHGQDVRILSAVEIAASVNVYNMEVQDFHTYFIGEHEFWAHNACLTKNKGKGKDPFPPPSTQQRGRGRSSSVNYGGSDPSRFVYHAAPAVHDAYNGNGQQFYNQVAYASSQMSLGPPPRVQLAQLPQRTYGEYDGNRNTITINPWIQTPKTTAITLSHETAHANQSYLATRYALKKNAPLPTNNREVIYQAQRNPISRSDPNYDNARRYYEDLMKGNRVNDALDDAEDRVQRAKASLKRNPSSSRRKDKYRQAKDDYNDRFQDYEHMPTEDNSFSVERYVGQSLQRSLSRQSYDYYGQPDSRYYPPPSRSSSRPPDRRSSSRPPERSSSRPPERSSSRPWDEPPRRKGSFLGNLFGSKK